MQTDNMHGVVAPAYGYLHAVDELNTVRGSGLSGFSQTAHIIVIGQRQHFHFATDSTRHQFGRGERAVGDAGMAMQVVVQH